MIPPASLSFTFLIVWSHLIQIGAVVLSVPETVASGEPVSVSWLRTEGDPVGFGLMQRSLADDAPILNITPVLNNAGALTGISQVVFNTPGQVILSVTEDLSYVPGSTPAQLGEGKQLTVTNAASIVASLRADKSTVFIHSTNMKLSHISSHSASISSHLGLGIMPSIFSNHDTGSPTSSHSFESPPTLLNTIAASLSANHGLMKVILPAILVPLMIIFFVALVLFIMRKHRMEKRKHAMEQYRLHWHQHFFQERFEATNRKRVALSLERNCNPRVMSQQLDESRTSLPPSYHSQPVSS
ncbi:hypothetical protein C8F01DRAFT_1231169 [Mycena amicta]|nr:hypothetical protein C8F01DRAFT_1231169 [Mycena amicta]